MVSTNLLKSTVLAKTLFNYAISLALISLLAGCVSTSQVSKVEFDPSNFIAQGKIALRYPYCPEYRPCEEKGLSASMDWSHQGQEDSLTFYDPLGQAQATLIYADGLVIIEEDGQSQTTNESSLEQELGIPLPIESLRELILNQQAQSSFDHQGWRVQVKDWQGNFYRSVRLQQKDYHIRVLIYAIK